MRFEKKEKGTKSKYPSLKFVDNIVAFDHNDLGAIRALGNGNATHKLVIVIQVDVKANGPTVDSLDKGESFWNPSLDHWLGEGGGSKD